MDFTFLEDYARVLECFDVTAASARAELVRQHDAAIKMLDSIALVAHVNVTHLKMGDAHTPNFEPLQFPREPVCGFARKSAVPNLVAIFCEPVDVSSCILTLPKTYEFGLNTIHVDIRDRSSRRAEWVGRSDVSFAVLHTDSSPIGTEITGEYGEYTCTFYATERHERGWPIVVLICVRDMELVHTTLRVGLITSIIKCAESDAVLVPQRDMDCDSIPPYLNVTTHLRFSVFKTQLIQTLQVMESVFTWYRLPYAFVGYNFCSMHVGIMDTVGRFTAVSVRIQQTVTGQILFSFEKKHTEGNVAVVRLLFYAIDRAVRSPLKDVWSDCNLFLLDVEEVLESGLEFDPGQDWNALLQYIVYSTKVHNLQLLLRNMRFKYHIQHMYKTTHYEKLVRMLLECANDPERAFDVKYAACVALKRLGVDFQHVYVQGLFEQCCIRALLCSDTF